jgi:hypothetical protein
VVKAAAEASAATGIATVVATAATAPAAATEEYVTAMLSVTSTKKFIPTGKC